MCVSRQCKIIAEGMDFDEDLIDEIDTNNERDEDSLQNCVEVWVSRLKPFWKNNMGEDELAQKLRHIQCYCGCLLCVFNNVIYCCLTLLTSQTHRVIAVSV